MAYNIIRQALLEDSEDITTKAIVPPDIYKTAVITSKSSVILVGANVAAKVFEGVDKKIKIRFKKKDGSFLKCGDIIAEVYGPARSLLFCERTALNFLQHLSGIATLTNKFVNSVRGTGVKILDTRKTIPGLRVLEKYAVKIGGGTNHRMGLYDMYLIKNNHVDLAGSVTEAVMRCHANKAARQLLEVEVRNFDELYEAVVCGVDIIMLDNFSIANAKKAVKNVKLLSRQLNIKRPRIEISGNITLANVRDYAKTGADFISIGAITHSAPAADIHMAIRV